MMQGAALCMTKGIPRDLQLSDQKIVPLRSSRGDPQPGECFHHDAELEVKIVVPGGADEGEVHIAQVVVDRSAPADSPHDRHVVPGGKLQVALEPWVLVATNDQARIVSPDDEAQAAGWMVKEVLLPCEIRKRIG